MVEDLKNTPTTGQIFVFRIYLTRFRHLRYFERYQLRLFWRLLLLQTEYFALGVIFLRKVEHSWSFQMSGSVSEFLQDGLSHPKY